MKIITYTSADAPEKMRWMAVQLEAGTLLPVRHLGATEEAVRTASQTFWDTEQQKLIDKGATLKAPKKPKATKDAPAPAAEDEDEEAIG